MRLWQQAHYVTRDEIRESFLSALKKRFDGVCGDGEDVVQHLRGGSLADIFYHVQICQEVQRLKNFI